LNDDKPNAVASTAPTEAARDAVAELSRVPSLVKGEWRVENGELVTGPASCRQVQMLIFGDPTWTDYDIQVDARCDRQTVSYAVMFRYTPEQESWLFSLGGWGPKNADLVCLFKAEDGFQHRSRRWLPGTLHGLTSVWQKIEIKARGDSIRASVDGKELANSTHPRLVQGQIGFYTFASGIVRWRNPKVRDPTGKLLWEGFPDLQPQGIEKQTELVQLPQFSEPPVIEAGELCGSATPGKRFDIRLGDFEWQDYDVHVECRNIAGQSFLLLRCSPDRKENWAVVIGPWGSTHVDIRAVVEGEQWWTTPSRRWLPEAVSVRTDEWRSLDVRLRGPRIIVRLDDRDIATSEHAQLIKGCIGMSFTNARWRNLEVRAPSGELLWEVFSEVIPRQAPPANVKGQESSVTDNPTAAPTDK
jgi:hypothetical protein